MSAICYGSPRPRNFAIIGPPGSGKTTLLKHLALLLGAQVVEKCLAEDRPKLEELMLAADCEKEALELRGDLRDRIRRITEGAVEDTIPIRRL